MIFPSLEVMKALAALARGVHFSVFNDDRMGVQIDADTWVEVRGSELAELTRRGWIVLDEDDPDTQMPVSLRVTEQGQYAIDRFEKKNKLKIVIEKRQWK